MDSGCINMTETVVLKVEKILSESMVSKILNSVENAVANKPKLDKFITRFSKVYTPIVVVIALITAVVPPLLFNHPWYPVHLYSPDIPCYQLPVRDCNIHSTFLPSQE